jgi:hypothetical protein
MVKRDIIVIGASAGVLQALSALLVRSLIYFQAENQTITSRHCHHSCH